MVNIGIYHLKVIETYRLRHIISIYLNIYYAYVLFICKYIDIGISQN